MAPTPPTRALQRPSTGSLHQLLVATLALAGAIHLVVGVGHRAGDAHGAFFVGVGAAQVGLALALAFSRRARPAALRATVVLSILVAGVWAATRVPGLPGGVESPGVLDLTCTAAEGVTALCAVLLLRRGAARGHVGRRLPAPVAGAAVAALVVLAAPAAAHDHHHEHGHIAEANSPASVRPSIFGDLFEGHGLDGHHPGAHPAPGGAPAAPATAPAVDDGEATHGHAPGSGDHPH
jgi:hypothetical protein